MPCYFQWLLAASNANRCKPVNRRPGRPNRPAKSPRRHFCRYLPGRGPGGVFIGEIEKTITQRRIGGIAGETAATLGLFAKVKRLRHRTHSQRGGSPFGLSVAGA
jgi:hypothetical protein